MDTKEQVIQLLKQGKNVKEIQTELNISEYMWKKLGFVGIPKYNNIFLELNEISTYWLGFLWADGSLTKNSLELEINSNDEEHLNKFKDLFTYISTPSVFRRCRHNSNTSRVIITDRNIASTLRNLGFGKKSERVVPNIPKELMQHFIRGYFDGDGSCIIRNHNGNVEYRADISGTLQFIDFIKQFLINPSYEEVVENKTWTSKRIYWYSKQSVTELLNYLTENSTIKLERKYSPLPQ